VPPSCLSYTCESTAQRYAQAIWAQAFMSCSAPILYWSHMWKHHAMACKKRHRHKSLRAGSERSTFLDPPPLHTHTHTDSAWYHRCGPDLHSTVCSLELVCFGMHIGDASGACAARHSSRAHSIVSGGTLQLFNGIGASLFCTLACPSCGGTLPQFYDHRNTSLHIVLLYLWRHPAMVSRS